MPLELPFEIWQHVLSFLAKEEVWRLRTLNTSINEIARNRAYSELEISASRVFEDQTYPDILRKRRQSGASRTKALYIIPGEDSCAHHTFPWLRGGILSRIIHPNTLEFGIADFLSGFSNVTRLDLFFPPKHVGDPKYFQRLARNALKVLGPNLVSLKCRCKILHASLILSSSLFFPRLITLITEFCPDIHPRLNTDLTTEVASVLSVFITKHRETLRIVNCKPWQQELFRTSFPNIINFSYEPSKITLRSTEYLNSFLQRHSDSLQVITVTEVLQRADATNQVHICADLPNLKHLRLHLRILRYQTNLDHSDNDIQFYPHLQISAFVDFARTCVPTLTSLELTGRYLTDEEWSSLMTDCDWSQLKYFKVYVTELSLNKLNDIGTRFTSLETLELHVVRVGSRQMRYEPMFMARIRDIRYRLCPLYELIFHVADQNDYQTRTYRVSIADTFPSLHVLNGGHIQAV